ncbi:MAG TPA: ABC transporter permease [Dongiaceae bacterium]|jgi:ribose transport system permease protein
MTDLRLWLTRNYGPLLAMTVFALMFGFYFANFATANPSAVILSAANTGVLLAFVAMAQTIPVLTRGLDLSVGMIFIMTNCLASAIVIAPPIEDGAIVHHLTLAAGVLGVLLAGLAAGLVNGAIVVYGRLQPIIATLATGAIYYGIALGIRPIPGGDVDGDLADFMTGELFDVIPTSLVLLVAVVLFVWLPFRRSVLGRGCYAAGSAEGAAYMSGVDINRSKLAAYMLCGLLAGIAGLMQTFNTYTGEASAPSGGLYTLNSIAAVVIGGTSLYGGSGGVIGSIFGAFILRTIVSLLFVFDMEPLWQPLFQGVVLLLAVSLGAARVLRIRNRLELFG